MPIEFIKTSELPLATTPLVGDEEIVAAQGTTTVHITPTILKTFMVASAANIWGYVTAYADLPLGTTASDPEIGDLVGVNTTTGTWLIGTQRRLGFYKRIALTGVAATDYGTTPYSGFPNQASQTEANAGIDDTLTITPYTLANRKRTLVAKIMRDDVVLTTGDNKFIFVVPEEINGFNLTKAHAFVTTASSSGLPTFQVRNITTANDMLSTAITIDATENTSYTAVTQPLINANYDDVVTGNMIAIDCDVAGTGAMGLGIILTFEKP